MIRKVILGVLALILAALFAFLPAGAQTETVPYTWATGPNPGTSFEFEFYLWHPAGGDTLMVAQTVDVNMAYVEYTYGLESRARVRALKDGWPPSIWSLWSDVYYRDAPPSQPGQPVVIGE